MTLDPRRRFDELNLDVRRPLPDSDGDGVSDVQERIDGTDPHDAGSVGTAGDAPTVTGELPLRPDLLVRPEFGGLLDAALVEVQHVAPDGTAVDQGLPTVAGTTPVDTTRDHFGIGDHDLIDGRVQVGRGALDEILGQAEEDRGGAAEIPDGDGFGHGAYMDLVEADGSGKGGKGGGKGGGKDGGTGPHDGANEAGNAVLDFFDSLLGGGKKEDPAGGKKPKVEGLEPLPKPKPKAPPKPGSEDDYYRDPDATTDVTPTQDEVDDVIVMLGANVNTAQERPIDIDTDGPLPTRYGDLVSDPGEDGDQPAEHVVAVDLDDVVVPADTISLTVNPDVRPEIGPTGGVPVRGGGGPDGDGGGDDGGASGGGQGTEDPGVLAEAPPIAVGAAPAFEGDLSAIDSVAGQLGAVLDFDALLEPAHGGSDFGHDAPDGGLPGEQGTEPGDPTPFD